MSAVTGLPHRIALTGAANVRDLGGYRTVDGHTIRLGRLYRSDSLHRATPGDIDELRRIGVRTVIDLRSPEEVAKSGPPISAEFGADHLHLALRHSRTSTSALPEGQSLRDVRLGPMYRRYLEVGGETLAASLKVIAQPERAPVLFHCFAGKDRTGVLAALVLSLLGLDDETVVADYVATAEVYERFMELTRTDDPPILDIHNRTDMDPSLLQAQPETMFELLAGIRDDAGSVEALVARWGIGADLIASMRAHLLD